MELTAVLQQIDSLKKEAESLQPVKPDYSRVFWDKFQMEFNYNSNHIEGNTMTYGHTQLLLIFGKVTGDYDFREVEEMKAHNAALKKIIEDAADPDVAFTEKFIKDINSIILVEPYYRDAVDTAGAPSKKLITPGNYKELPNHVQLQNGEIFRFSAPEETRAHMGDLMEWYRKELETKELHPVQLAALFHYQFIRIHPFDDGNGRTVRLLMNYILMKHGYAPIVVESADKKNYLTALNKADTGDISAFVDYIASVSARWQEIYSKAMKGEKIEEPDDFEKEVEVLKRKITDHTKVTKKISTDIIDSLFTSCFKNLILKLINKLSPLDSLFYSKQINFGINQVYRVIVKSYQIEKVFQENKDKIINRGTIDFRYILQGLHSKNNGVIDVYTDLKIKLEDFTYWIENGQNKKILQEKRYTEIVDEEEIETIVSTLSKETLKQIKENT